MIAWLRARAEWAWFGIAAGVMFLIALVLGRRQQRPPKLPLESQIDRQFGRADVHAEERAKIAEELKALNADLNAVLSSNEKSADELARAWNERKRRK